MFESVRSDPGEDSLKRAARIFFVLAALGGLATAFFLAAAIASRSFGLIAVTRLSLFLVLGGVAWLTGRGIEARKVWAKWLGIALGFLELLNFPIGTVIGIAILVYLNRAIKAGVFVSPEPAT